MFHNPEHLKHHRKSFYMLKISYHFVIRYLVALIFYNSIGSNKVHKIHSEKDPCLNFSTKEIRHENFKKTVNELVEGDVKKPSKFTKFTNAQDYGYDFVPGLISMRRGREKRTVASNVYHKHQDFFYKLTHFSKFVFH